MRFFALISRVLSDLQDRYCWWRFLLVVLISYQYLLGINVKPVINFLWIERWVNTCFVVVVLTLGVIPLAAHFVGFLDYVEGWLFVHFFIQRLWNIGRPKWLLFRNLSFDLGSISDSFLCFMIFLCRLQLIFKLIKHDRCDFRNIEGLLLCIED